MIGLRGEYKIFETKQSNILLNSILTCNILGDYNKLLFPNGWDFPYLFLCLYIEIFILFYKYDAEVSRLWMCIIFIDLIG